MMKKTAPDADRYLEVDREIEHEGEREHDGEPSKRSEHGTHKHG